MPSSSSSSSSASETGEKAKLLKLFRGSGHMKKACPSWNEKTPLKDWQGITLSSEGHVEEISVTNTHEWLPVQHDGSGGTTSTCIAYDFCVDFTAIPSTVKVLNMPKCNITNDFDPTKLPSSLEKLSLVASFTNTTSPPPRLDKLPRSLRVLYLGSNEWQGPIPDLSHLPPKLEEFAMDSCPSLTGCPKLENLPSTLRVINLSGNDKLSGVVLRPFEEKRATHTMGVYSPEWTFDLSGCGYSLVECEKEEQVKYVTAKYKEEKLAKKTNEEAGEAAWNLVWDWDKVGKQLIEADKAKASAAGGHDSKHHHSSPSSTAGSTTSTSGRSSHHTNHAHHSSTHKDTKEGADEKSKASSSDKKQEEKHATKKSSSSSSSTSSHHHHHKSSSESSSTKSSSVKK